MTTILLIKCFFEEFSTVLEQFSTDPMSLCLVGDFNFKVEDTSNGVALQFLNFLECFNLSQHVRQATYHGKHILDLSITRADEHLDHVSVFDPAIPDHSAVFRYLLITKPP